MIDVQGVYKSYGDTVVLSGASFTAEPGAVTALVGPNGSGKTTTLHLLAGLTAPDGGTLTVGGRDVTDDRRAVQRELAFLPQDVRFHDALTPRQVLRFYAGLRDADTDKIGHFLHDVALDDNADQPCGQLSGGMRQRLGLALLQLADASVLILDEPGLSLDPEWRAYLMDRVRTRVENGTTVLMSTHLLDVWRPLVDRVLHCANGHVYPESRLSDVQAAGPTMPQR